MKLFLRNEVIAYVREPFAFFFSILLPIALIFLYGESFGQYDYSPIMNGYDLSMIFNLIFLVANLGCMGLVQSIVEKKATAHYKREAMLPLVWWQRFVLNSFSTVFVVVLVSSLVLVINYSCYNIQVSLNLPFFLVYGLLIFNFFAFGYQIAMINLTSKAVQGIGLFSFFVFMFTSGLIIPFDDSAGWLKLVSDYSPFNIALKCFESVFAKTYSGYEPFLIAVASYTGVNILGLMLRKNRRIR